MPKNCKDLTLETLKMNIFVYGESGTGKTSFAGGFPKPYFFDFDNGMLALRGKDVDYDTYVDLPGENPKAFREAQKKMQEFFRLHREGKLPYQTIVIDSLSTLQDIIISDIKYTNGTYGKPITQPEWGMIIPTIKKFVTEPTFINCHVVVLGHVVVEKDELTGVIKTLPLVYGKQLPELIPLWFDLVFNAEMEMKSTGIERRMRTVGDGRKKSKDRLGVLNPIEVSLSYDGLMKKIAADVK